MALITAALALCLFVIQGDARSREAPRRCSFSHLPQTNVCNTRRTRATGEAGGSCEDLCKMAITPESYQDATCEMRNNGKKECVCHANCAVAGSWGDPNYFTFSGTPFSYHGRCTHTLIQTTEATKRMATAFAIAHKATPLDDTVTAVGTVLISIPTWKIILEISRNLTVNGKPQELPYHLLRGKGQSRIQLDVVEKPGFGLDVRTSFGLVFQREFGFGTNDNIYVYIPKSVALAGNTEGLLGKWDDTYDSYLSDANGTKRYRYDSSDMAKFGDSFCLDQPAEEPKTERRRTIKRVHKVVDCNSNATKSALMDKCNQTLTAQFSKCLKAIDLDQVIKECRTDVCFAKTPQDETNAPCNAAKAWAHLCADTVVKCDNQ